MTQDRPMKSKEVLAYLDISRATLYRMMADGDLPSYKVGGTHRFYLSDVQATIKPQQHLSWDQQRIERAINYLVKEDHPATIEEREALKQEWRDQGEDAVLDARRYQRRQERKGKRP